MYLRSRIAGLLSVVVVLSIAACGRAAPRQAPEQSSEQTATIAPTDTATVRRLCVSPDSVLAKRKPCVLRPDHVGPRRF